MKHHRHAQHDPKRQLTKAHIAHIVGFMICRMGLEEVTPKVVRTVWNYMPKEEPPDALWTGIDYIKKHAARGLRESLPMEDRKVGESVLVIT